MNHEAQIIIMVCRALWCHTAQTTLNCQMRFCWVQINNLTHWGQDKMAAIFQTTVSNPFSWMKMHEFWLKFHWSLFLMVRLTIFQHWFRKWLGADQATSHYLNQWWLDYRRIYASLGPNELTKKDQSMWHAPDLIVLCISGHPRRAVGYRLTEFVSSKI